MQPCTFVQVARPRFISLIGLLTVYLVSTSLAYASTPASLYEQNNPGEEVYFLLEDHLGSVDIVTDESANVVERRDFLPYGEERLSDIPPTVTAVPETKQKFTGKELDEETGLYYYGARYYDPTLGRFISSDPWEGDLLNPQTLNKYSYVTNNPLKYIDPTGMYNMKTGEVEKGDTLSGITGELNDFYGTKYSYKDIAKINSIGNPDSIRTGQKVRIGTVRGVDKVWQPPSNASDIDESYINGLTIPEESILNVHRPMYQQSLPKKISEKKWYEWLGVGKSDTHNLAGSKNNLDYRGLFKNWRQQAIYNSDNGTLVETAENMGSFDYASPILHPFDHAKIDVKPWLDWGNSPHDTTTKSDRIGALGKSFLGKLILKYLNY